MPSPPPPPPPAPPRLAPAAAAASLTAERFRAQKRADAVAVQKRARDGRVLARRLEGITRLASGVDLGEDSDDDDGGQGSAAMEVEQPEAGPSSVPWPGKGKKGTGKGKGKKASREALREVLTWASLFTLSPTLASPPLPTSGELVADYLALGPIPNGKRCLLVTGPGSACSCLLPVASLGSSRSSPSSLRLGRLSKADDDTPPSSASPPGGTTAPTTLHTRMSARVLLKWVAPLPGGTVLDCLLPNDWKATGVLCAFDARRPLSARFRSRSADLRSKRLADVLDCLRWKEMDIAASGATLRCGSSSRCTPPARARTLTPERVLHLPLAAQAILPPLAPVRARGRRSPRSRASASSDRAQAPDGLPRPAVPAPADRRASMGDAALVRHAARRGRHDSRRRGLVRLW